MGSRQPSLGGRPAGQNCTNTANSLDFLKFGGTGDGVARKLPPLNAIKAFEAVARLGSLSQAARELAVTPGAVSQQIRLLGEFFGKSLFVRKHNRLQLTDAGLSVFADTGEVFERLSTMTERLLQGEPRLHFVVSALPSLAAGWLSHRLGAFLATVPEVRCELRVEDDPVDFTRDHIDVRLCYGEHLYPELVTLPLLRDEVAPLCTPEFRARSALSPDDPATLQDGDLIHTDWGHSFASYPTWGEWFRAAGAERRLNLARGHKASMSSFAVDLAASGAGIALGQRLLSRRQRAEGLLVAPFSLALPLAHDYCLVHPHAKTEKTVVQQFIAWLRQEV